MLLTEQNAFCYFVILALLVIRLANPPQSHSIRQRLRQSLRQLTRMTLMTLMEVASYFVLRTSHFYFTWLIFLNANAGAILEIAYSNRTPPILISFLPLSIFESISVTAL
jgi:hypothetical protein